jgi:stage V sporulation protein SpoVS
MAADVHLRAQTVPMPVQLPGDPAPVKVAAHSDPRKVAGKLAHTCRTSAAPSMVTTGSSCINQAVKAICIARGEPSQVDCMHLNVQ